MTQVVQAQIIARRDEGGPVVDLAVQTPSGVTKFVGVPDSGFLFAGGLVVGLLVGSRESPEFIPIGGASSSTRRAIILSSAERASPGHFTYTCVPAEGPPAPEDWTAVPGGETFSVYHVIAGNNGTGRLASGILISRLQGFSPVPLANGTPIRAEYDGEADAWYVQATQAIDGDCPGGG